MDIRGFFGGSAASKKNVAASSSLSEAPVSSMKSKKNVIGDDEDDKDIPSANAEAKVSSSDVNKISQTKENMNTQVKKTVAEVSAEKSETILGSGDIPKELESIITWRAGEKVPYSAVVACFESVSSKSGRLDKENCLANLFRAVIVTTPSDLEDIVYLASNNVAPAFEGLELGIGDSLLVKAVCQATGRTKEAVDVAYRDEGDLGVVALSSKASQKTLSFATKPKPLIASDVLDKFRKITQVKGDKAQQRKIEIIKALMIQCMGAEAKYVVRALQGKLRIGTAAQTVLVSLGTAFAKSPTSIVTSKIAEDIASGVAGKASEQPISGGETAEMDVAKSTNTDSDETSHVTPEKLYALIKEIQPEEAKKLQNSMTSDKKKAKLKTEDHIELCVIAVKRAFSECPSYSVLVDALLKTPIYSLYHSCKLVPGFPVAPMLAKPTKAIGEVLRRLAGQAFTMEYKYDGERAQVHLLENGTVKIFSRNSLDDTQKYPDLAACIHNAKHASVTSCVVDCEVVAWHPQKKCILPFQVLSTRKRKVEEGDEQNQEVKVVLQGFDMLYCNGKSLLQESLRDRRRLLRTTFSHTEGYFHFASGQDHVENGDTCPIETFLQEACSSMMEGLMVKTLDDNATYEPSKRSLNWLKLKKDYIDGMGVCDSVDLVVIGGYHGKGKRTSMYGAYLMACYDPEKDEYQSTCKVGTGFKDEELVRFTDKMQAFKTSHNKMPYNVKTDSSLEPDDWFEPSVVWELQAADLSKSSAHKAAIGKLDPSRGIGLRFPRFIREREDKKAENATNADQIVDMYNSQDLTEVGVGGEDDDDDAL